MSLDESQLRRLYRQAMAYHANPPSYETWKRQQVARDLHMPLDEAAKHDRDVKQAFDDVLNGKRHLS